MSETTYWAAEVEPKKLIERSLMQFARHLGAMQRTGRLGRARRGVNAYYGRGPDGFRDSSAQVDVDDGALVETHVNKIRPAITNALSIICGTRPALKPRALNSDAIPVAQTRLAAALIEVFDEKQDIEQLQYQLARGGLVASSWWAVDSWRPNDGAAYAVDPDTGYVVYEGGLETILLPPWRIAADPTPTEASQRRWVLFKRKEPLHDLAATAEEKGRPDLAEKLRGFARAPSASGDWLSKTMATQLGDMDADCGDDLDPSNEVWVWELRHLDAPALRGGRQVRFVEPDLVLFDSWAVQVSQGSQVQDEQTGEPVGRASAQTQAVPYPYEGLHAQEFCPERMLGSTHGHSPAFDLQGLQEFHDVCTTSMSSTLNLMGLPHLHAPPSSTPQQRQLGNGITVIESPVAPVLIEFPALKTEVVQAAEWASSEINLGLALNDTVMGKPPKGMPASAQALQRAQAVQFNQGAQKAWVKIIGASATSRLRILKRFAKAEEISKIAGASGGWQVEAWGSTGLGAMDGFDVDEVNPISDTFEGRQSMGELLGLDGEALYDFLTTGSLPLAVKDKQAAHEYAEKVGHDLESGRSMAPIDPVASQMAGEAVFLDDGQKHITISRNDPLHLVLGKAAAVMRAAKTAGQVDVMEAAGDVCARAFELWVGLSPDELFAYNIPPLPSHQLMAGAPPPTVQDEQTGEAVGEMPDAGQPDENPALPKPPPNPIDGESEDATSLNLGEMNV